MEIKVSAELRPCVVQGEGKALFHKWVTGHVKTYGLVELEDGQVGLFLPGEIRFCDNAIKEYSFEEAESKLEVKREKIM